jgi:hypothetical protein
VRKELLVQEPLLSLRDDGLDASSDGRKGTVSWLKL